VQWHTGELFPRVGFIVTNLRWKHSNVVKFYNKRGTAEQWIKEGKYALKWTRLWRHDFDDNQVRLQLFVMAYNIGNFLRRLALPNQIKDWSLRTMREKLVKIGAKVVRRRCLQAHCLEEFSEFLIYAFDERVLLKILRQLFSRASVNSANTYRSLKSSLIGGRTHNR
jgi:hypothetical protein